MSLDFRFSSVASGGSSTMKLAAFRMVSRSDMIFRFQEIRFQLSGNQFSGALTFHLKTVCLTTETCFLNRSEHSFVGRHFFQNFGHDFGLRHHIFDVAQNLFGRARQKFVANQTESIFQKRQLLR